MQNTESWYFSYRTKTIKGWLFSILLLKWILFKFFKFFTSSLFSFILLFNLLLPPREQSLHWLSCLPPTTSNLCVSFKMYPYHSASDRQQRCRTFLPRRCCKDKAEQGSEKLIKCLADILITLFKGKKGRFCKDILWIVNAKNYLMTFILQHLSFRLEIFYEEKFLVESKVVMNWELKMPSPALLLLPPTAPFANKQSQLFSLII